MTDRPAAGRMAFQEVDAVSLISPLAKLAVRPPSPEAIPKFIDDAYRTALFGKPGATFVDLPANLILGQHDVKRHQLSPYREQPLSVPPPRKIQAIVDALKAAKAPLVVFGKGTAYARAERHARALIDR